MKAPIAPRCSFCGKSQNDVRKLISGPTVYICDECVELCNDIIAEVWATEVWDERDRMQTSDGRTEPAASGGPLEVRHTPVSREDVPRELMDRLRQPLGPHSRFFRFWTLFAPWAVDAFKRQEQSLANAGLHRLVRWRWPRSRRVASARRHGNMPRELGISRKRPMRFPPNGSIWRSMLTEMTTLPRPWFPQSKRKAFLVGCRRSVRSCA